MRLRRIAAPHTVATRVLGYTSNTNNRKLGRFKSAQKQKYEANSIDEKPRESELNIKLIPIVHEKSIYSESSHFGP